MTQEWIGMNDRQRLLHLFDAAYSSQCDLVLWEHDEPDAPEALRTWASTHGVSLVPRPVAMPMSSADASVTVARTPGHCRIEVYIRQSTGRAA